MPRNQCHKKSPQIHTVEHCQLSAGRKNVDQMCCFNDFFITLNNERLKSTKMWPQNTSQGEQGENGICKSNLSKLYVSYIRMSIGNV